MCAQSFETSLRSFLPGSYPKRRCRFLGPHNVEAVLFEQPGCKQPQNLLVVDHKSQWMRCFVHHPNARTSLKFLGEREI